MLEPRAICYDNGTPEGGIKFLPVQREPLKPGDTLFALPDLLAALREPSEEMKRDGCIAIQEHYRADGGWCGLKAAQEQMTLTWDAMLSAFEKEHFPGTV